MLHSLVSRITNWDTQKSHYLAQCGAQVKKREDTVSLPTFIERRSEGVKVCKKCSKVIDALFATDDQERS